jgi:hypothetical protein
VNIVEFIDGVRATAAAAVAAGDDEQASALLHAAAGLETAVRRSQAPTDGMPNTEEAEQTDEGCDAWINGAYCDKPVTVNSLCESPHGLATMGSFCCVEHAATMPRPPLDEAEYWFIMLLQDHGCCCGSARIGDKFVVCIGCGIDDQFLLAWQRLLNVYPKAVEARPQ